MSTLALVREMGKFEQSWSEICTNETGDKKMLEIWTLNLSSLANDLSSTPTIIT